jgi:AraC-like DNA-binding protein
MNEISQNLQSPRERQGDQGADLEFQIQGRTFTTLCSELQDSGIRLERRQNVPMPLQEINAFGKYWQVVFRLSETKPIGFARDGGVILERKYNAAYLPPYSLIEWILDAGDVHWVAFLTRTPPSETLAASLSDEPFAFHWDGPVSPASMSSMNEVLKQAATSTDRIAIGKQEKVSAVALRTKKEIDRTFREPMAMESVSERLGYSHAVMTRSFRACYGIPPVVYRNNLRVFEAMVMLMTKSTNATESCYASGFSEFTSFYRQFVKSLGLPPSRFVAPESLG